MQQHDHELRRRASSDLLDADGQDGGGTLDARTRRRTDRGDEEGGPPLLPERVFAGQLATPRSSAKGGMGEVWVADQAAPVQRRVAIKVVRPGLDSERMLARFEQGRQAAWP